MKWEYKTEAFSISEKGNEVGYTNKFLNERGVEGWELVAAFIAGDAYCFIFKRPIQESTNRPVNPDSETHKH